VDNKTTGIIVDSVSEVLRLPKNAIEPPPPIVAGIEAKYLRGIGKLDDGKRLIILLNLNEILTVKEKEELARMKLNKPQESVKEPVKLESAKPKEVDQSGPGKK